MEGIRHGELIAFAAGCRCDRCTQAKLEEYAIAYKLKWVPPYYSHKCELCGSTRNINMDHDHETKEFRGWLCTGCNTAIGTLGDNVFGLQRAVAYLSRAEDRNRDWVKTGNVKTVVLKTDEASKTIETKKTKERVLSTDEEIERAISLYIESFNAGNPLSKHKLAEKTERSPSWCLTRIREARARLGLEVRQISRQIVV